MFKQNASSLKYDLEKKSTKLLVLFLFSKSISTLYSTDDDFQSKSFWKKKKKKKKNK